MTILQRNPSRPSRAVVGATARPVSGDDPAPAAMIRAPRNGSPGSPVNRDEEPGLRFGRDRAGLVLSSEPVQRLLTGGSQRQAPPGRGVHQRRRCGAGRHAH